MRNQVLVSARRWWAVLGCDTTRAAAAGRPPGGQVFASHVQRLIARKVLDGSVAALWAGAGLG